MNTAKPFTHTPATARIQARLERLELDHLRALVALQAEEIERLRSDLDYAECCADMWQRGHHNLVEHLDGQHTIGLTQAGELVVVVQEGGAA